MATLENNLDTMPCRHCGSPVRPGMIRCRECRGILAETGDEFELAPQVAAAAAVRKCARCGTVLEEGIDDCPSCASALLDDLLKGPAEAPAPPPEVARTARPTGSGTARAPFVPLREVTETPAAPPVDETRSPAPRGGAAPRRGQQAPKPAAGKANGAAKARPSIEDEPPGLFGDDEDEYAAPPNSQAEMQAPARPAPAKIAPATNDGDGSAATPAFETSAACLALLSSLASADANLRVEIAAALGKLGDKAAMGPLERHLVDQDIRVRRAVASALVQLGHPKGETLLDIAERKPATEVLSAPKAAAPRPKAKRSTSMSIDGGMLAKLGVAVVAIAVCGGGIWYFMNGSGGSGPRPRGKKKSTAAKKITAAPDSSTKSNIGD